RCGASIDDLVAYMRGEPVGDLAAVGDINGRRWPRPPRPRLGSPEVVGAALRAPPRGHPAGGGREGVAGGWGVRGGQGVGGGGRTRAVRGPSRRTPRGGRAGSPGGSPWTTPRAAAGSSAGLARRPLGSPTRSSRPVRYLAGIRLP